VSIVGARPRRSPTRYAPSGKDVTPDRRGFRSVSFLLVCRPGGGGVKVLDALSDRG
jgi:hypothetical protein